MWVVNGIFENVGTVQDGITTIAQPRTVQDRDGAMPLQVHRRRGALRAHPFPLRQAGRRDRRARPGRAAGREDRPGRPVGRRQVDPGQRAAAAVRPGGRAHPDRRPGHRRRHPGEPALADRRGHPGHLAAASLDPRQPALRPSRRQRGADRRGGAQGARRRVHSAADRWRGPHRLRRPGRRARGEALRRPAPAHRDRPRAAEGRADPGAGRGHLGAGLRSRGGHPGQPGHADAGQDGDCHRPPPFHHRADGPAGGAGQGPSWKPARTPN